MERGWRKRIDDVKDKIMDGYKRGVCNKDGETIKAKSGRPVAKPRNMGRRAKRYRYDKELERLVEV